VAGSEMGELESSRVDGGLLGKSNILQLAISCPSRACKIPLRANRTQPLSRRSPLEATSTTNRGGAWEV